MIDDSYTVDRYLEDLDRDGMEKVWLDGIFPSIKSPSDVHGIISIPNFGELYEIGLAHVNKQSKKSLGKYFTPDDVATLMAKWLLPLKGENVCDVCCGVGNLTLAYLRLLDDPRDFILSGSLWLYDKDELALRICVKTIGILYGKDVVKYIHSMPCDFLDINVHLPSNCKIISNPPYAKVEDIPSIWNKTGIVEETRELYAAIMEKCMCCCDIQGMVMVTPQNYLGREKFKSLRSMLCSGFEGFVVPFDNTPGQLFNGKKHGVFNTNTQNQVRPAIMVIEDILNPNGGLRIAGMVRFRNSEREKVLDPKFLEGMVGRKVQLPMGKPFVKCFPQLESIFDWWKEFSDGETFKDWIDEDGDYYLNFVTTCRYNTVAYVSDLFRSGKRMILFNNEQARDLAYCWLNSSFCYWHWRLYDGEITYQKGMLDEMPTFLGRLGDKGKKRLLELAKEMRDLEPTFIATKKNSGKMMENVKFPERYRDEIDDILLEEMCQPSDHSVFDIIHAHSISP